MISVMSLDPGPSISESSDANNLRAALISGASDGSEGSSEFLIATASAACASISVT